MLLSQTHNPAHGRTLSCHDQNVSDFVHGPLIGIPTIVRKQSATVSNAQRHTQRGVILGVYNCIPTAVVNECIV